MEIKENISLKPFNTFGIDVLAREFIEVSTIQELTNLELKEKDFLILGGGSNILFTKDYEGLVIKLNLGGIHLVEENESDELIKCMAGENWHDFVTWTLQRDLGGLENLSLIPGNVGTAPMQNIGAYGVEVKDTVETVEAVEIATGELIEFTGAECEFGYRESFFKKKGKGKFIITAVYFRLNKNPKVNISYGAIASTLEGWAVKDPDIHDVSRAVIYIRQSKLPDPEVIGNGGSFFKNPVVDEIIFRKLENKFPNMPHYKVPQDLYKIPAGWLIENTGWKGKKVGDCGVHEKQALVLVNHGKATGLEIWSLAQEIIKSVENQFGIVLEPEINII